MIYIFDEIESYTTEQLNADITTLPEQRRQKAEAFRHEQGRKENVLAYKLLCNALKEEFGIDEKPTFTFNEHDKPSIISHPEIHFNLSHCKRAVACIVSRKGSVGIDVECIGRYNEQLARYTLNDEEFHNVVNAEDVQTEFIRYWTMKEALLKYLGTGITDDLKNILTLHPEVRMHTVVCKEKGYVYSWCE